jgi:hypothetical protein
VDGDTVIAVSMGLCSHTIRKIWRAYADFELFSVVCVIYSLNLNPLTLELNPSAQCCLPRFFIGDFNL